MLFFFCWVLYLAQVCRHTIGHFVKVTQKFMAHKHAPPIMSEENISLDVHCLRGPSSRSPTNNTVVFMVWIKNMKPWYITLAVRSLTGNQEHIVTLLKPRTLVVYVNIRHKRGMELTELIRTVLSIFIDNDWCGWCDILQDKSSDKSAINNTKRQFYVTLTVTSW